MDIDKFKKDMSLWGLRQHQNYLAYYDKLVQGGYTLQDVKEYIRLAHKEVVKTEQDANTSSPIRLCPECGRIMKLMPVNISPGTMTGDPTDKFVWMCFNPDCYETIYSSKTIQEIVKETTMLNR